ncbi:hypothetical protein DFA_10048 [Cavenderia fasciculata]|uniref:Molybdate-anion transporter n=1 Tax=Cavenderia fasciculata TaxID=261658 RepID=F4Q949_CACFS|nr:uncharacterized protein DFA_10048 [Cavenderia fasciculata]EGG15218.1 hypothetical protein DFA_10048 [Cavenderia fasciculata]|eukprot:XP_004351938.1 hypothetical protein DFA_10048 [Cavenderia fasciculata]
MNIEYNNNNECRSTVQKTIPFLIERISMHHGRQSLEFINNYHSIEGLLFKEEDDQSMLNFTNTLTFLIIVCALLQYFIYKRQASKPTIWSAANGGITSKKGSLLAPPQEQQFKRFQTIYLVIYLLAMAADWLQGPYVYALYESYGFLKADIAFLFVSGFLSSMIFGVVVGPITDKYGRKFMTIIFGILYSISCLTKLVPSFNVLLFGRITGGISTSLLFSVFESWMVSEHNRLGYPEEYLDSTFYKSSLFNGIVAIVAGIWSSYSVGVWGFVSPFMWALALLVLATALVFLLWTENYGDSSVSLEGTFANSWQVLRRDGSIIKIGFIQSLFEASMYTFVFMWTPTLQESIRSELDENDSSNTVELPFGIIFASFMVCFMIGSSLYKLFSLPSERIIKFIFLVSIGSMIIPFIFINSKLIYLAFLIFEVCCGMYYPCMGSIRSKIVPESARASILNYFRVPLNFFVVAVLSNISNISTINIFKVCSLWLFIAYLLHSSIPPNKFNPSNNNSNSNNNNINTDV